MRFPHVGLRRLVAATATAFLLLTAAASAATSDFFISNPERQGDPIVGSEASYSYDVLNQGPDAAEATVSVSPGAAEELISITPSQGSCTQTAPVTCALGPVTPGVSLSIATKVRFTKEGENRHLVRVDGAADSTDPDLDNNLGGLSFEVTAPEQQLIQTPRAQTTGWSRTQATLDVEAELSPFGSGTYFFEYGATKTYGHKTPARAVSGQEAVTRKTLIKGLGMGKQYHYRVVLVVDGKSYRGKDRSATTLGRLVYPLIKLTATKRAAASTKYTGSVGDGLATAPGACKGKIRVEVYTLAGATLLTRNTTVRADCRYAITIPFGTTQARRYGAKGKVLVQARFSGSRAVASAGSASDRP